jgi:hypothetical protein
MNLAEQQQQQTGTVIRSGSMARAIAALSLAVIVVLASAWIAIAALSSRTSADPAVTSIGATSPNTGLVEFRRGEQGAVEPAAAGAAPNAGFVEFRRGEHGSNDTVSGSGLNPGLLEFRRGERGD